MRNPKVQRISAKHAQAMKRAAQARDRKLIAQGIAPPEAMFLLRPERIKGARVLWPDASLIDD
jgi:hypothetical protein